LLVHTVSSSLGPHSIMFCLSAHWHVQLVHIVTYCWFTNCHVLLAHMLWYFGEPYNIRFWWFIQCNAGLQVRFMVFVFLM
jgi:hypothetical protein